MSSDADDAGGCLALFLGLVALAIVLFVVMWSTSAVGYVLDLTPTYEEMDRHSFEWIEARYENPVWGYVLTVLVLLAGIPLCFGLTTELANDRPDRAKSLALALPLIALVTAVAFAPVGPRAAPAAAGAGAGIVAERAP